MPRTPLEVKQIDLPVSARGYNRAATDQLLKEVATDYEAVWWERKDLRDEIERLESERAGLAEQERLVSGALMAARGLAERLRREARRRAKALVRRAEEDASELVAAAERERDRLAEEALAAEWERDRLLEEVRRLQSLAAETRTDLSGYLTAALERIASETGVEAKELRPEPEAPLADDLRAEAREAASA